MTYVRIRHTVVFNLGTHILVFYDEGDEGVGIKTGQRETTTPFRSSQTILKRHINLELCSFVIEN